MELADQENLEATVVATVTDQGRLTMTWNGNTIVDIARAFLDTNGVEKHTTAITAAPESILKDQVKDFRQSYLDLAPHLNVCSKRGLSERFDSTIGRGHRPHALRWQVSAHPHPGHGQQDLPGGRGDRHLLPDGLGL